MRIKNLQKKLKYWLENVAAKDGLHFLGASERIARIYRAVGDVDQAKKYFGIAVEKYEEVLPRMQINYSAKDYLARCCHVALLHQYAGNDKKSVSALNSVIEVSQTVLKTDTTTKLSQGYIQFILITAHLLRGEYSTALSYLEDFLANVEFYRGKIPVPLQPTLDAMKKVLIAYETHNYNLVETTITELRRHFESLRKEGRLAIDTASLITDWDILAILENIPNQIRPKEDDYQN